MDPDIYTWIGCILLFVLGYYLGKQDGKES